MNIMMRNARNLIKTNDDEILSLEINEREKEMEHGCACVCLFLLVRRVDDTVST
jgi:hypothetical protein